MVQFEKAVERYGKLILNELKTAGVKCWIAGGSLRDYFSGINEETDYDIFFPNGMELEKALKHFQQMEAVTKWDSDNGTKLVYRGKTFDLVKKFFDGPQATIDAFDFTVSMFAVDFEKVYHGESSFIDLAKKQLMINKITYPASTMQRAFRYYKKGFSMCAGEMRKMVEAIQEMPKPEISEPLVKVNEDEVTSGEFGFFAGID